MTITDVSDGMRVQGTQAAWEGEAGDLLRFRVEFERPLLSRMWTSIVRFLNKPLIRL